MIRETTQTKTPADNEMDSFLICAMFRRCLEMYLRPFGA